MSNVKTSSSETYHSTSAERNTLRHRIARYILMQTCSGKPVTRKDIARFMGIESSTVAGRVNEIEKNGIELDGKPYRLEYLERRVKDPVTGKHVEAFALINYANQQMRLAI